MADFYNEPMYAAAPHPTVPLFRGAVPARVLASTPGNMRPASTAGMGWASFQRFGVGSWRADHKSWWRVARRYWWKDKIASNTGLIGASEYVAVHSNSITEASFLCCQCAEYAHPMCL